MTQTPTLKQRIGKLIPYPLIAGGRRVIHLGLDRCEVCGSRIRQRLDVGYGYPALEQLQVVGGMRRNRDRCPVCLSSSRERLIWYYLTRRHFASQSPGTACSVTHFAPEKALSANLQKRFGDGYQAYDFAPSRYRHLADVRFQNLEELTLADKSVDLLICNHVLEHVGSVAAALAEIRRVLKPSGLAILQVPIALKLAETIESNGNEDDAERIRKFGQADHLRLFSRGGYLDALAKAGFVVEVFDAFEDDREEATRWSLDPFEELFVVRPASADQESPEPAPDAATAPDVSVAIVAYNAPDHLDRCLASVTAQTKGCTFEVLVIDNGDGRCEALARDKFPGVRVIPSEGNIGFGAGCNRVAASARGGMLLFLNPDTRLRDDAVTELLAFARSKPTAGVWGGRTVTERGEFDGGNQMTVPSLGRLLLQGIGLGRLGKPRIAFARETDPRPADVLCGGFFMIAREAWDRVGGFDESFFLYCEEIDLFVRLKAVGYRPWVTPKATIVHDVGSGTLLSPTRLVYKSTGEMHFLRKHMGPLRAGLGGALIWAAAARRYVAGALLSAVSDAGREARRAYHPVVHRPGAWFAGYRDRRPAGARR